MKMSVKSSVPSGSVVSEQVETDIICAFTAVSTQVQVRVAEHALGRGSQA
jgi:hypothetical protein